MPLTTLASCQHAPMCARRGGMARQRLLCLSWIHDDLHWLIQLNHAQMAAVRDIHMQYICTSPQDAKASVMLLAFICGRLTMLQRLKLVWGRLQDSSFNPLQLGGTADA